MIDKKLPSKTFCAAPWHATYYKASTNRYKMCCVFNKRSKADSPEDYYNSDIVKSVRESIMKDKWHPGCSTCKEQEEAGIYSDRESFMKLYDGPFEDTFKLKWLDFRPGNLCNLKCRMCGSIDSSMIQQEVEKYPELQEFENQKAIHNSELLPSIANHETFSKLEFLKLLGGEPTIDPQIQKLLDWTIEKGYAKNINLRYTTNATNVNARWVKAVNEFKTSRAQISLDGTGETYDYIRTNANWNAVRKNVLKLPQLMPNLLCLGTNIVFTTYNCFTIDKWLPELFELREEVMEQYDLEYDFNIINCMRPDYMITRNLPDEFKDVVIEKLDSLENKANKYGKIVRALKYFTRQKPTRDIVEMQTTFFKRNDILDRIRKTDIHKLDPIYEKLRKCA